MSIFKWWAMLAGVFGIALLTACSSGSSSSMASGTASSTMSGMASSTASSTADTIVIKNFMFSPATITVAPGAKVTVRNEDSVAHTLTGKKFSTGDIAAGQSKTFSAPNTAGSYSYICMIHQYMTGTLVVR